jgi:hypothetical protein
VLEPQIGAEVWPFDIVLAKPTRIDAEAKVRRIWPPFAFIGDNEQRIDDGGHRPGEDKGVEK